MGVWGCAPSGNLGQSLWSGVHSPWSWQFYSYDHKLCIYIQLLAEMHRNPAIPVHESDFRTRMNAFSVSCCRPHPGFALASCGPCATSRMLCIPGVDWSVILTELRYLLQQYCAHDVSNYRPTSSDSQLLSTIKWHYFQVSRQLSSA